MDPLERVIRPIVEGQIRGFIKEHPSVLDGVNWYKKRADKAETFTNSLAKRIVRDLACSVVRARLAAALLQFSGDESSFGAAGKVPGASPAGIGTLTDAGGNATPL